MRADRVPHERGERASSSDPQPTGRGAVYGEEEFRHREEGYRRRNQAVSRSERSRRVRSVTRPVKRVQRAGRRTLRRVGGLGVGGRQSVVGAMVAAVVLITADEISLGNTPTPGEYVAPFAVFLILAVLAEFGSLDRLAGAFALLVLLVITLNRAGLFLRIARGLDHRPPRPDTAPVNPAARTRRPLAPVGPGTPILIGGR